MNKRHQSFMKQVNMFLAKKTTVLVVLIIITNCSLSLDPVSEPDKGASVLHGKPVIGSRNTKTQTNKPVGQLNEISKQSQKVPSVRISSQKWFTSQYDVNTSGYSMRYQRTESQDTYRSTTSESKTAQYKTEFHSTITSASRNLQSTFESTTNSRAKTQDMVESVTNETKHIQSTPKSKRRNTIYNSDSASKSTIPTTSSHKSLVQTFSIGENATTQTIPCPNMCFCNEMSYWETYIRQKMRLMNSTITARYTWQEIGEMIEQQSINKHPSKKHVISTWKKKLFKHVTCYVGENQELYVDLNFRQLAFGNGNKRNFSVICSNNGKILINDVDTFLESGFVVLINCSVRTERHLRSSISEVKTVSVLIYNSTLSWLNNITMTNLNNLYSMFIYNTPLNGHPNITNQTEGKVQNVYFEYNDMVDTNCSFTLRSKNISGISITHNHLRKIPACLLTSSVTSLILSNNRLEDISAFLYPRLVPATNLTDLRLDNNLITNIGMFSYMKLDILDLSYNNIEHLNKLTFNRLPELTYLDLSRNMITTIPVGTFKAFYFLQFLNLSHNLIKEFSHLESPLSPADINIHNNKLIYPPFFSNNYASDTAHTIKAQNNPYHCDCQLESFKQYIQDSKMNTKYKIKFKNLNDYKCFSPKSLNNQTLLSVNFTDTCPVVMDCPASCECWLNKTSQVTDVKCRSLNMTSLPVTAPQGHLVLLFSHNNFNNISTPDYFIRAEQLNLSRNALVKLDSPVCELWKHLNILDISHNKIKYLPQCFKFLNLSTMSIHMYGNPWVCECNSIWMLKWFKENKLHIPDYKKSSCANNAFKWIPLDNFDMSRLDCDPKSYLELAIPLGILTLIIIAMIPVAYKFRFETQVFIHARFHVRPFDRRKQKNAIYMYEIFLSYASENEAWVVHTLMPKLENRERAYRVCVHYRDFEVGTAVADNIQNAVQKSQCTMVILSKDYIASEWCMFEFQKANHEVLKDETRKLIVILMEDIPVEILSPELTVYLKRNTYLRIDDKWFWQKLFYCLPDPLVILGEEIQEHDIENHQMHELVAIHHEAQDQNVRNDQIQDMAVPKHNDVPNLNVMNNQMQEIVYFQPNEQHEQDIEKN